MADEDAIEQTLHVARAVSVFRIPPRPGVHGWRSGEWLVADKLFSGRLRIVAKGELCEIRLEDVNSNELFAMCPVPYGQRNVCVEPVADSSRYYVLRVEDPATKRHAFLGMGFDNRSDAFDFNEALVRHEQQVAREQAAKAKFEGGGSGGAPGGTSSGTAGSPSSSGSAYASWGPGSGAAASSSAAAEMDALYRHTAGLKLQEGQTIRVSVSGIKKGAASTPTGKPGFLDGPGISVPGPTAPGGAASSTSPPALPTGHSPPPLLPPPPHGRTSSGGSASGGLRPPVLPPPPSPVPSSGQLGSGSGGLFQYSDGGAGAAAAIDGLTFLRSSGGLAEEAAPPAATAATATQDSWATFD